MDKETASSSKPSAAHAQDYELFGLSSLDIESQKSRHPPQLTVSPTGSPSQAPYASDEWTDSSIKSPACKDGDSLERKKNCRPVPIHIHSTSILLILVSVITVFILAFATLVYDAFHPEQPWVFYVGFFVIMCHLFALFIQSVVLEVYTPATPVFGPRPTTDLLRPQLLDSQHPRDLSPPQTVPSCENWACYGVAMIILPWITGIGMAIARDAWLRNNRPKLGFDRNACIHY